MSDATIVELIDFLFVFFAWCFAMTALHGLSQIIDVFYSPNQDQE
jgi:hypothetical protein